MRFVSITGADYVAGPEVIYAGSAFADCASASWPIRARFRECLERPGND
jgi:hypothetical protein